MPGIGIYDGVFSEEQSLEWYQFLAYSCKFRYGETDRSDLPPTGMIINIRKRNTIENNDEIIKEIHDYLLNIITTIIPSFNENSLIRSYINLFIPKEIPYFHQDDSCGTTCMFYINPVTPIDEGGETQFYIDGNIKGVCPVPGRLVTFDGNLIHRATSFRNIPRITLVYKFIDFNKLYNTYR